MFAPAGPSHSPRLVRLLAFAGGLAAISAMGGDPPVQPLEGFIIPFRKILLSSPVDELISKTPVDEGHAVKAGQLVIQLRSEEQLLDVKRAAAMLRKAEFDATASRELVKDKIVSEDKALEQEVRLDLARVEHDVSQLKVAERALLSPLNGIVSRRLKEEGESVARMEPVAEIMEIERVFVLLHLAETDLPLLSTGQVCTFQVSSLKSQEFSGRVDFIDPVIDPGSGLFRVKILVENQDGRLRPGMKVELRRESLVTSPAPSSQAPAAPAQTGR